MPKEIRAYEVGLDELLPDPSNANAGNEEGQQMIDTSIIQTGLNRGVAVDANNVLYAGNKTHRAALEAGFKKAIIVETDGDTLVVTKRRDFDLLNGDPNNVARKAAYLDNRSAELSLTWDLERIAADVGAGLDLDDIFNEKEIEMALASLGEEMAHRMADSTAEQLGAPPTPAGAFRQIMPSASAPFVPEYNPTMGQARVTSQDVDKASDRIGNRFDTLSQDDQVEVMCPHCAETFFIKKAELR
jgi:hypothetical protein